MAAHFIADNGRARAAGSAANMGLEPLRSCGSAAVDSGGRDAPLRDRSRLGGGDSATAVAGASLVNGGQLLAPSGEIRNRDGIGLLYREVQSLKGSPSVVTDVTIRQVDRRRCNTVGSVEFIASRRAAFPGNSSEDASGVRLATLVQLELVLRRTARPCRSRSFPDPPRHPAEYHPD